VWNRGLENRMVRISVFLFGIQLALNSLWSYLFFGLRELQFAFIEIVGLWIAVAFTAIYFSRVSRRAGLLLIPYILWVSLAAMLNFSIYTLNT